MAAVDSGVGTQITFATTGFTAEVTSIRLPGLARTSIPTAHLGTAAPGLDTWANKTFLASRLSDQGSLTLVVHFNPQSNPPIDAAPELIDVRFPFPPDGGIPLHWDLMGFVTALSIVDSMEEALLGMLTIKLSRSEGISIRQGLRIFQEGFEWERPMMGASVFTEGFEWVMPVPGPGFVFQEGFEDAA